MLEYQVHLLSWAREGVRLREDLSRLLKGGNILLNETVYSAHRYKGRFGSTMTLFHFLYPTSKIAFQFGPVVLERREWA